MRTIPFLLLLVLIISCQINKAKELPPSVIYVENFEERVSENIDTSAVRFYGFMRNYYFKFLMNTQTDTQLIFDIEYVIKMNFIQIDNKEYIIPIYVVAGDGFYSRYHNSIPTIKMSKDSRGELEFEFEICLNLVEKEMVKKDGNYFPFYENLVDAIPEIINSETSDTVVIRSSSYLYHHSSENKFCRKFKINRSDSQIFVEKVELEKFLKVADLIEFGEIEIIESGNILNTINFVQK